MATASWVESLSAAYLGRTALLLDQGCSWEACAALRASLKLSPDSEAALELGRGTVRLHALACLLTRPAQSRRVLPHPLPPPALAPLFVVRHRPSGASHCVKAELSLSDQSSQANFVRESESGGTSLSVRDGRLLKPLPLGLRMSVRGLAQHLQARAATGWAARSHATSFPPVLALTSFLPGRLPRTRVVRPRLSPLRVGLVRTRTRGHLPTRPLRLPQSGTLAAARDARRVQSALAFLSPLAPPTHASVAQDAKMALAFMPPEGSAFTLVVHTEALTALAASQVRDTRV